MAKQLVEALNPAAKPEAKAKIISFGHGIYYVKSPCTKTYTDRDEIVRAFGNALVQMNRGDYQLNGKINKIKSITPDCLGSYGSAAGYWVIFEDIA